MERPTFIEYLTELMVDDDPAQALQDVKRASRNPEQFRREQMAKNVDDQRALQQDRNNPTRSEEIRIAKMEQQVARSKKRVAQKQKQEAKRQGLDTEGQM